MEVSVDLRFGRLTNGESPQYPLDGWLMLTLVWL